MVTYGIGSAASGMFTNWTNCAWQQFARGAFQALAHGSFQGGMMSISGGKFWNGFAAGALSSIASSAWGGGSTDSSGFKQSNNWAWTSDVTNHQGISGFLGANGTFGQIAFGTIAGGGGAKLSGGNFWQGAVTGLFVSGLNHLAHQGDSYESNVDEGDPPPKSKFKLSNQSLKFTHPVQTEFGMGIMEFAQTGPLKGVQYLTKMAKNPNFVSSAAKKVGDFWEYSVKLSGSKGSFTIYKKYLNAEGKTIKMFHDTYDKTHKFLHREFMNGQERIKIYYDGTRQWFSKLY